MNPEVLSTLDTLRTAGAQRFDPVSWHHIEALAERSHAQPSAVQRLLADKLLRDLQQLQSKMARGPSSASASASAPPTPAAKPHLTTSPLGVLLQAMQAPGPVNTSALTVDRRPENPRVRQFRQQLGKISVQKQVSQAIAQAPQNAGPINSHMLVLRALGLMRDISPDYLGRFMAHVDSLLSLEDSTPPKLTAGKKSSPKPQSTKST